MCRLAAFPPGFPAKLAHEIVANFASWNRDGTGVAYLKRGEFVIKKWPKAYDAVKRMSGDQLFGHMPHDGWTIVHVRAATHGNACQRNTHPFVKGPWAVVHNGIFSEYQIAGSLMTKLGGVEYEGETDSEVAAELFYQLGPVRFSETVNSHSGAFLGLHKDGTLAAVNTGGSMEMVETKHGMLVASHLPRRYKDEIRVEKGWIKFDPKGQATTSKFRRWDDWGYVRPRRRAGFHAGPRAESAASEGALGSFSDDYREGRVYLLDEKSGRLEERRASDFEGKSSEEEGSMLDYD